MGSRVENSYKEYIRQGRDIAIALAMAHEDEKIRLRDLNRPPLEIPTYKYVEPYVSDEDRGIDPDEIPAILADIDVTLALDIEPEVESKDVSINAPTARISGGPLPQVDDKGYSHESLPGKSYKTAPALKAALTALAKREAANV